MHEQQLMFGRQSHGTTSSDNQRPSHTPRLMHMPPQQPLFGGLLNAPRIPHHSPPGTEPALAAAAGLPAGVFAGAWGMAQQPHRLGVPHVPLVPVPLPPRQSSLQSNSSQQQQGGKPQAQLAVGGVKRPRGRPRKHPLPVEGDAAAPGEQQQQQQQPPRVKPVQQQKKQEEETEEDVYSDEEDDSSEDEEERMMMMLENGE
jgi:hypothetical protein